MEIRDGKWYDRGKEKSQLPEEFNLNPTKKQNGFVITLTAMLALAVLGRGVSWFHTVTASDITYAAWIPTVLSYLAEILVCARVTLAIAGIICAVYAGTGAGSYLAAAAIAALLDYGARFVIDFATKAIVGAEAVAAIWLTLQLLLEMLFVFFAYVVAVAMKRKFRATEHPRQAEKYSVNRATTASLLLVMLSRIALEVWYLVDFLLLYSDITATETASMVGSFLKVLVIYGGVAVLLGEGYTEFLKKNPGNG